MLNEKFTEEEIMASTFVFLRCGYLYTHTHTHTRTHMQRWKITVITLVNYKW